MKILLIMFLTILQIFTGNILSTTLTAFSINVKKYVDK